MKSLLIAICILSVSIFGCRENRIIDNKNIKTLKIIFNNDSNTSKNITDRDSIKRIVMELNKATKELSVFKSLYTIKIIYTNRKEQLILCNGERIMVNGLTYSIDMSVKEIINNDH